jgi:hypothetical protein
MVFDGNMFCTSNGCENFLVASSGSEIFVAIFLAVFIFLGPIFSRELRKSKSIILTYWFLIFLHEVVAFLNAHFFSKGFGSGRFLSMGTYGAKHDANLSYHVIAKELTLRGELVYRGTNLSIPFSLDSFLKGGTFYYELLGNLYQWFGSSLLIGEQFSILVFALSCIVLLKIIRRLELDKYPALSLAFFGALPTIILLGSITLRESYEIFFFMLAVYFGVKTSVDGKLHITYFCMMAISAFLMGLFHFALVLYSIFIIILFMVWPLRPISQFGNVKKLQLLAIMLVPLFSIGILFIIDKGSSIFLIIERLVAGEDTIFQKIMWWREDSMSLGGSTTYNVELDSSTPFKLIYSYLKVYVYYLIAGFSMQIKSFLHSYNVMEAMLRLSLLWFSVLTWWGAVGLQKRLLGLMLILYLGMSLFWAMGTTNVGTAMRHHLLTWWIIVSMGLPLLVAKSQSIWLSWVCQSKRLS